MNKVMEKKNFGKINFGTYKGKEWNDLPKDYLQYLISDECRTSEKNKNIAKQVLSQYDIVDGQLSFI